MEEITDLCEEKCIHPNLVENTLHSMPDLDTLFALAELFKVFGDTTRVRIICALFENELCVCDIAEVLGMGQSAISHQLRLLRNAHLVRVRREGKSSFYSLDDDHVRLLFEQGLSHVKEENPHA
ncbi:ArsR/SmtB family transcription factor [Caproiciproducens sp. R2]|uniref:ArsR/SmtB family transcription factor n=1 Tax=Caproiciproducens sp. R2 TaxID=3435187 RepID=UPI004034ECFF